jgi:hypothetical protein
MKARILFALMLAIAPGTANAQIKNYTNVGTWAISEAHFNTGLATQCWAITNNNQDGTKITIKVDTVDKRISVSLTNPDWKSLKFDENFPVKILFDGSSEVIDEGFNSTPGSSTYGSQPGVFKWLHGSRYIPILQSFRNSKYFIFESNGRLIGRYSLQTSMAAMDELSSCVDRVSSERKRHADNDPFRN